MSWGSRKKTLQARDEQTWPRTAAEMDMVCTAQPEGAGWGTGEKKTE